MPILLPRPGPETVFLVNTMAAITPASDRHVGEIATTTTAATVAADIEKTPRAYDVASVNDNIKEAQDGTQFQSGVQRARAITGVWSTKTMVIMFALLYLVSFVDQLLVSMQYSLNPFITSSFQKHGLLSIIGIVSNILSGCFKLPLAKLIDTWGRVEGFIFMIVVTILGVIMKACAKNMETYVAGDTMYWVGHLGVLYVIGVMLSDMTTLKNRMLLLTINGTPLICSTFAGPRIAKLFYDDLNFRWGFGSFAIIFAGVSIPVMITMLLMERKAVKMGAWQKRRDSGRTWSQSIIHWLIEIDTVGIILVCACFALILLPFSIVSYAPNGWKTGYIIAMEVVGVVCGALFFTWEKWFAPVQFLPFVYLKDPTLLGSCTLYGMMFVSCFAWNGYFSSYLQVVHGLDIDTAGYVLNTFSLSAAILSPFVSLTIRWTGNFKWVAYTGVPFTLLGTALLIPLRKPSTSVGLLVMTQIFVGLGTGVFATCGQLAVMAICTHQEIAAVSAIWGMFGSIGASIGSAIAGGLWNNIVPNELYKALPEDAKNQSMAIFRDVELQLGYPIGSPARDAIIAVYGDIQRKMVIVGAVFVVPCIACIFVWRNINLKKLEEEKGTQTNGKVW